MPCDFARIDFVKSGVSIRRAPCVNSFRSINAFLSGIEGVQGICTKRHLLRAPICLNCTVVSLWLKVYQVTHAGNRRMLAYLYA